MSPDVMNKDIIEIIDFENCTISHPASHGNHIRTRKTGSNTLATNISMEISPAICSYNHIHIRFGKDMLFISSKPYPITSHSVNIDSSNQLQSFACNPLSLHSHANTNVLLIANALIEILMLGK